MNIEDKLKYFNLKESFNEEDLNKAYQQKLAELNTNYELLKSRLKREDTISYKEQTKEKINEIIWKIIFASNIDEEMAKMLFALLLDIRKKITTNELDSDLISYLINLKYDGSKDDLKLLYDISNGIIPNIKNLNSYGFKNR